MFAHVRGTGGGDVGESLLLSEGAAKRDIDVYLFIYLFLVGGGGCSIIKA